MTRASQDGNRAELRDALSHGLRTMAVATVFGALALFALAGPLGMFFSGGDKQDGVMLAQTLTILALSTPFMSANFMMSRVFYANEDARTPFYIQLLLAVVYVAGAFAIQFLPVGQIIYAIAILYMVGNILSVVISAYLPAPAPGPPGRAADRQLLHPHGLRGTRFRCCRCRRPVADGQLQRRTASPGATVSQPW